jgi:sugar diacid utilization regulator
LEAKAIALSDARERIRTPTVATTGREELPNMERLLLLSMRMAESADEVEVLDLAVTAVAALSDAHLEGIHLTGVGWLRPAGECEERSVRDDVESQFAALGRTGGEVALRRARWAWAFPLLSGGEHLGQLVLAADREPAVAEQLLLRLLAQQTGAALAHARVHLRQDETAAALQAVNAKLVDTVQALERNRSIHERLTQVAVAGKGIDGIVGELHELTGRAVAVEDRYGNLRAWAGPDRPEPYPKASAAEREQLQQRARLAGSSVRHGDRLVALVAPQPEMFAVLALVDPDESTGEADRVALEYGATILAIELSRLHGLTETEMRLGRDLVDELIGGGLDDQRAIDQAQGLDYDLQRPHRVVVVDCQTVQLSDEAILQGVLRAARGLGMGTLHVTRGHRVVLLAYGNQGWERLRRAVLSELRHDRCVIGVGTVCTKPGQFPRSYRTARLALEVHRQSGAPDRAVVFDELGVFRMLAESRDLRDVERLAREWLGSLIEYDRERRAELVATLDRYLGTGRNHGATAKALSVHRSTLKYRLQRVHEISGHDLGDPETLFNLQFALRAWQTLRALRAEPI